MRIAREVFSAIDSRLPFQKGLSVLFALLIAITSIVALVQFFGALFLLQYARGLSVLSLLVGALAGLVSGATAVYVYFERGIRRSVDVLGQRFVVMPLLARILRVSGEAVSLSSIVASPLWFLSVLFGGGTGSGALVRFLDLPFRNNFVLAIVVLLLTLLFAALAFLFSYAIAEVFEIWASMANDLGALRQAQPSTPVPESSS